jgi:hypothetical protein
MAPTKRRSYPQPMHHHHAAPIAAIWISIFASTAGGAIAIFAGVWRARHPAPQPFDFAASARRIRAMPIPARDDG